MSGFPARTKRTEDSSVASSRYTAYMATKVSITGSEGN
jgi:hypothetical protein